MSTANLNFGGIEVKKSVFHKSHKSKHPIDIGKVNVKKILTSNKVSFSKRGFKYFIGYRDDVKVKPLCIILPKMSGYAKYFDETKYLFVFY